MESEKSTQSDNKNSRMFRLFWIVDCLWMMIWKLKCLLVASLLCRDWDVASWDTNKPLHSTQFFPMGLRCILLCSSLNTIFNEGKEMRRCAAVYLVPCSSVLLWRGIRSSQKWLTFCETFSLISLHSSCHCLNSCTSASQRAWTWSYKFTNWRIWAILAKTLTHLCLWQGTKNKRIRVLRHENVIGVIYIYHDHPLRLPSPSIATATATANHIIP